jgi:hypothetical protein
MYIITLTSQFGEERLYSLVQRSPLLFISVISLATEELRVFASDDLHTTKAFPCVTILSLSS